MDKINNISNDINELSLEITQEASGYTRLSRKVKRIFDKFDTLFIYTTEFFTDLRSTYNVMLSKALGIDSMIPNIKENVILSSEDSKKFGENYAVYDAVGMSYSGNDTLIENAHYIGYKSIKLLEDASGLSFRARGKGDSVTPKFYDAIIDNLGKKVFSPQPIYDDDVVIPMCIKDRTVKVATINMKRGTIRLLNFRLDKNKYKKSRRYKVDIHEIQKYNTLLKNYLIFGIKGDRGINSISTLISDIKLAVSKIEGSSVEVKDGARLTNALAGASSTINILGSYIDYIIDKESEIYENVELLQSY